MSDWVGNNKANADNATDNECSNLSIAEMVAQTANQFVSEKILPGFEYYEEFGAYYNRETGYYYYPNSYLFFHPFTQCYYRFNEETNEYETLYSDLKKKEQTIWTKKGSKRRAKNIIGEEFVQNATQEDVDIMELTLDLVDRCSFLAGDLPNRLLKKTLADDAHEEEIDGIFIKNAPIKQMHSPYPCTSSDEEDEKMHENLRLEHERRMAEEEMAREAPCIRLIVQPGNKLHIVTILGANIGFSPRMDIQLENSAKFDEENGPIFTISYSIDDSANIEMERRGGKYQLEIPYRTTIPVYSSGMQLVPSTQFPISHEDVFQAGNSQSGFYSFTCHIHSGLNTCAGCEPGLFAAKSPNESEQNGVKKLSKNAERRRQNRALKEQYGLFEKDDSMQEIRSNYVDRAKERRKKVGSVGPIEIKNRAGGIYARCLATPIPGCSTDSVKLMAQNSNSPKEKISKGIEEQNKGFQLLKGMGWKSGEGLGKNKQGIQEPIATAVKNDRGGFGMEQKRPKIAIQFADERQQILEKTKERYEQILKKQNDK